MRFKIGAVVRYDAGPTALMRLKRRVVINGSVRWYGMQCCGGVEGAYQYQLKKATKSDLRVWGDCKQWRRA